MACNPTRLELSNSATTTVQVTIATDPGDDTPITLQVDELSINESQNTSSGVATFTIAAVSAANNSIWDATIQVGSNSIAAASVQVVETNVAQTVGVTVSDADVTYCAPTGGGAGGIGEAPQDGQLYGRRDAAWVLPPGYSSSQVGFGVRSIAEFLYPSEVTTTNRWYSHAWWSRKSLFAQRNTEGVDYAFITFGGVATETTYDGTTVDWDDSNDFSAVQALTDAQFEGHCDILVARINAEITAWADVNIDYKGMNARGEVLILDPEFKLFDIQFNKELQAAYLNRYANGPTYSFDHNGSNGLYWNSTASIAPTSTSRCALLVAALNQCIAHARTLCNRVSFYKMPAGWYLNDIRLAYDNDGNADNIKTAISTAVRNWSQESTTYTEQDRVLAVECDVWNCTGYNAMFALKKEYIGALIDGMAEYATPVPQAIWWSHYAWGQTLNDTTQRQPWSFFGWGTEAGSDDYTTTHTGSRTFTRFPMPPGVMNWILDRTRDAGLGVLYFFTPNEYGREAVVGTDVDDLNFSGVGTSGSHTFGTSGDADYLYDNVLQYSIGRYFGVPTLGELGDVDVPSPANGEVLGWNSTTEQWEAIATSGTGTVTSVGLSMPTGFTVTGSPVTSSGTLGVTWDGNADTVTGPVLFTAKNRSGTTMTKGQVVFISGHSGTESEVDLADADDATAMPAFGLVNNATANDNADVEIVTFGEITGLDTSAFSVGDVVYVSTTPGELTATPPTGESSLIQNMGKVVRSHATEGIIKVIGAGRTNATPNLDQDKVFLGNASNQAVSTALSSIGLSKFNDDLPAVQDSYLILVEAPSDKDYVIDGRAAAARTVTNFYAKTSSGTCTATLKNLTDATTIGTISVTSTGGSAASLTNTTIDENDRIGITISSNSSGADLEMVVEYTQ